MPYSYALKDIKQMIELEIALFNCKDLNRRLKLLADELDLIITTETTNRFIRYKARHKNANEYAIMIDSTKDIQYYQNLRHEKSFDKYEKEITVNGYTVTDLSADLNPDELTAKRTIIHLHNSILKGKIRINND